MHHDPLSDASDSPDRRGVAAESLAGFAERLLGVVDEGRRTATYKLALLLALIDACAESASGSGEAPSELGTRAIARHIAGLYWPQLRPFPTPAGAVDLRQITNKSATILSALGTLRDELPSAGTWDAAEALAPEAAASVLDTVEVTVARYPLVRLQTVDGVPQPFLYDINWGESVTLRRLRIAGEGRVRLRHGAGDQLVRLAPLVLNRDGVCPGSWPSRRVHLSRPTPRRSGMSRPRPLASRLRRVTGTVGQDVGVWADREDW